VEFDAIINNLNLIGYDLVLIDFIGTLIGTIKSKYRSNMLTGSPGNMKLIIASACL
jgi:hypothetical protein